MMVCVLLLEDNVLRLFCGYAPCYGRSLDEKNIFVTS